MQEPRLSFIQINFFLLGTISQKWTKQETIG